MTTSLDAAAVSAVSSALAPHSGIGFKPQHLSPLLAAFDDGGVHPGWVEVHPQNYFTDGGPPHRWLAALHERMPLSFHSTGLSLGSQGGPDRDELRGLASLCERYSPRLVSDHLSWSNAPGEKFPDLLPIPYTFAALHRFAVSVDEAQEHLGRTILVENPSRYLAFRGDEMAETEFLHELCRRTGCGLLLDVNNVDVSARNLGFPAEAYVDAIDPCLVGEIHLAGHSVERHDNGTELCIDDHGSPVSSECWLLFERFIARAGPKPTLVEWDTDVPGYATLEAEAVRAGTILQKWDQTRD